MFGSIKTKIMVMQIGLVLSVTIGLGTVSYIIAYSSIKQNLKQNLEYQAETISEHVALSIYEHQAIFDKIASSETVKDNNQSTLHIRDLIKNIHEFKIKNPNYAMLIDSQANILACSDENIVKIFEINNGNSKNILTSIKNRKPGYGRAMIAGCDSILSYAPVENQSWTVIIVTPYKAFISKLNALRDIIISVGCVVLGIVFTLAVYLSRGITKPISELVRNIDVIVSGDLSQRANINSHDEIGKLAASFNKMVEHLQRTTTSVSNLHREINERLKAEDIQHSLTVKLEQNISSLTIANRELEEFAHIAAHDLKAPLRAIGSLAGLLLSDYSDKLDGNGMYYLDTIIKRIDRMNELISGILTYSESGRESEMLLVNTNEIIRDVITNLDVPENVEVIFDGNFPTIFCCESHIQRIFQNLLNNAIKFMDKPKGYIHLKCEDYGNKWLFSVADNGRGIDEKYQDKIFRIFQTLDRRDKYESTGIGLSVAKRIVEKYNGRIWVESQPDMGSTFFFTFRKENGVVADEELQTNYVS